MVGAKDLVGGIACQFFTSFVPMGNDMVFIDQEGGDGAALNGLKQGFFTGHHFFSACLCEDVLLFGQLNGRFVKLLKEIFNLCVVVSGFPELF